MSHRTYAASLRRAGFDTRFASADVVYASWLYPDGAALAIALRGAGPLWLMVLGSDTFHLEYGPRCRAILAAAERAQGVVCVCRTLAERMIDAGAAKDKVHVVPNGVDTETFHPVPRSEAFGRLRQSEVFSGRRIDASSPLVLFIGNLVHVKGPDIMLRAWAGLMDAGTFAPPHSDTPVLVFIGDGPRRSELERMVAGLGVADSVCFAGARPHGELPLWLNAAAGLCLTSRSEGMPNVVLEALAVGLPVVATDVGACREMLSACETSWVVPEGEPATVAAALAEMLRIPPDAGRSVPECRSWRDQAREVLGLMRDA